MIVFLVKTKEYKPWERFLTKPCDKLAQNIASTNRKGFGKSSLKR